TAQRACPHLSAATPKARSAALNPLPPTREGPGRTILDCRLTSCSLTRTFLVTGQSCPICLQGGGSTGESQAGREQRTARPLRTTPPGAASCTGAKSAWACWQGQP